MGKIRTKRYSTKRKSRNNSNKRKSRKEKNYKKSRTNSTKRNLKKKKSKRFKSVKRGGAGAAAGPPDINVDPVAAAGGGDDGIAPLVRTRAVANDLAGLAPAGQVEEEARRQAAIRAEEMQAAAKAAGVEVFRQNDGGPRPMDVCKPGEDMVLAKEDDGSVNPDEYN